MVFNPEIYNNPRPITFLDANGLSFFMKHIENNLAVVPVGYNGTNYYPHITDEISRASIDISLPHARIHEGTHFYCRGFIDLGNGLTHNIMFLTPNTDRLAHVTIEIEHELEASVTITEDITSDDNGTALPTFNRNRDLAITAGAEGNTTLMFHTPTNPAGGGFPAGSITQCADCRLANHVR